MENHVNANPSSQSASARLLKLQNATMTLELAPSIGGSIARFYSDFDTGRRHWLRPATDAAVLAGEAEGMASFPLLPFCNRIRNGRARFQGRDIHLPPNRGNSPHAIHGIGWQQPWQVRAHDATSALLEWSYPGGNWPYPFHATQLVRLQDDHLSVDMTVENRGSVPMPLGLGHHPYLPDRSHARLTVCVDAMWGGDADVLPTGLERPALIAQLRHGVALSEVVQDNNFIGWDHVARVEWPAEHSQSGTTGVVLRAESPLDYFVLYSPEEHDFFCIEPVSNCTDWLNLTAYASEQVGGAVVAAGQTCRAQFSLTPWSTP